MTRLDASPTHPLNDCAVFFSPYSFRVSLCVVIRLCEKRKERRGVKVERNSAAVECWFKCLCAHFSSVIPRGRESVFFFFPSPREVLRTSLLAS